MSEISLHSMGSENWNAKLKQCLKIALYHSILFKNTIMFLLFKFWKSSSDIMLSELQILSCACY